MSVSPEVDGSAAQSIVRLEAVTKSYAHPGRGRLIALDEVRLDIARGSVHGIAGFSGAGKSTLLRSINLLERPDSGAVLVNGEDLTTLPERLLRERRRRVGMIFQEFNLLSNRTVVENVELPLRLAKTRKSQRRERALAALASVGLSEKALGYPERLSGGQKQRVGIARALVNEPDILLCDEATSALDPRTTDEILELLRGINEERGITIVVVTHEVHVINALCDRVSVMEKGRVVENFALGTPIAPQSSISRYLFGQADRPSRGWQVISDAQ
ncbi:methionine ABC transporter ATP-binding protein [Mycolicibacterium komossense]|uniref:methionine ABC transporter ATP-binding protein n=1 Tax=Mycolicibacterium komossense TaxID=1779 RepID=UPI0021F35DA5|nr:ATP-binding cassette domain-containing protein [Mycolicibacterium komossense]